MVKQNKQPESNSNALEKMAALLKPLGFQKILYLFRVYYLR